ncbi:hypothetical protein GDO86_013969 [Hymenochirus boettgeri]|uniref:Polycystin-1 n=1 Tax=Hymenochirus boettgeri TaxID=247094 RepID=A0A8T2JS77_9PIPI|nr:hypothetical protein GDO86_013969 [Hymenochirus boettgeri]
MAPWGATATNLECGSSTPQPVGDLDALTDTVSKNCNAEQGEDDPIPPYRSIRCPHRCRCSETLVNCSGVGLWRIPAAEDCPLNTIVMDVSRNRLTLLRVQDLIPFQSLRTLILSGNQIEIIEEMDKIHLPPLQTLDLSGNALPCTCSLQRLVSYLARRGHLQTDPETELCAHGPIAPMLPCADQFISCLPDSPDSVLRYMMITSAPLAASSCLVFCFRHSYSYYGGDIAGRCLCGSVTNDHAAICAKCLDRGPRNRCTKTLIPDHHPVEVAVSLLMPSQVSVFQVAEFSAKASVPITQFVWQFQSEEDQVMTTEEIIYHKYSLPGQYKVRVLPEANESGEESLVKVTVPVHAAELQCPSVVHTGQSAEVWLNVQQGTDLQAVYGVLHPDGRRLIDDSSCPRGGRVFHKNLHCYWLNQVKESFLDSRTRCLSVPGGDIAYITTAEEVGFIQESFLGHFPVWVNVSLTKHLATSPAPMFGCTQLPLVPGAKWQRSPCTEKAPSLCVSKAGVSLPDVPMYLVGVPVFSEAETQNISVSGSLGDSVGDTEIMLFPGLWFSHSGSPVSLEFGVQPLQHTVEVQIQILRPFCSPEQHLVPPGCDLLRTPYAICHNQPLCNTRAGCPTGHQWCPLTESCLNITSPCSPYVFENFVHPPRYLGVPPAYSRVADIFLQLDPNPQSSNKQVLLSSFNLSVQPDDILSIQHNGDKGSFLQCTPNAHSAWRQSYISINHSGWWEDFLEVVSPSWVDDVVCNLRVTFASEMHSLVVSPLLGSFQEPGTYTIHADLYSAVSETFAKCEVHVLRPVTDLQIIYPSLRSDSLHISTQEPTLLVITARSTFPARVLWLSSVQTEEVSLLPECPQSLALSLAACHKPAKDMGFAWKSLHVKRAQRTALTIAVTNEINTQNLSVQIWSHEPIKGLHIDPEGIPYVQVNQTQIFTAKVSQGSSVTYTWTVDNKEEFAYKGPNYTVTFKAAGSYRLRVQAENPISSLAVDELLTVHRILPLQNPKILAPSNLVLVSEVQEIGFEIQVDRTMDVTIRWDFGDGSNTPIRSFSPPYSPQLSQDPKHRYATLHTAESYRYAKEGHYEVTITAYDKVSHLTCSVHLTIVNELKSIVYQISPLTPQPQSIVTFTTVCLPSAFEVKLSWDFGDGSEILQSSDLHTEHVYKTTGFYNATLTASNGRSHVSRTRIVTVGQIIDGLELMSSGSTELGTDTVIAGHIRKGTNVTWSFDMGDGTSYINQSESSIRHSYICEGKFTISVVAWNPISSTSMSILVQVYQITITHISFPPITTSQKPTQFVAHTNVNAARLSFQWEFGDETPVVLIQGKAEVSHTYHLAGNYTVQLTVNGTVISITKSIEIAVEDQITSVTLTASPASANLSQPILLSAAVLPSPDFTHTYKYQWDFGLGLPVMNSSSSQVNWTYISEGNHLVSVTVWNRVSQEHGQCYVIIQRPISSVVIQHNTGGVVLVDAKQIFSAEVNQGATAEFTWYFGNPSTCSYGPTVTHTFHEAGNRTITVYAQNKVSQGTASINLSVLTPVTVMSLSADHILAEVDQLITFWVSLSSGNRVKYYWSMCELCPYIEGSSQFYHRFSNPGIYTVRVQANNTVSSAHASICIEMQERIKGISIKLENAVSEGYVAFAEPVTLTAHVLKGSNLTFQWVTWPEKWTGQGTTFTFTPSNLGDIWAEVSVKNALGVDTVKVQLKILERVSGVQMKTLVDCVALGSLVEINVTFQSGTDLQYIWDPGEGPGGLTSQTPSFKYTYLSPGSKAIKVTAFNILSSSNASMELTAQEAVSGVSINVNGSQDAVMADADVMLVGVVQFGTDLLWEWTVPGHEQVLWYNVQNVSHTFSEPGQYWLRLRVWNFVSSANASRLINVQEAVTGLVVSTDRNGYCTGQNVTISLSVQHGTNVSFVVTVPSLNLSIDLAESHGHLFFLIPGNYLVVATSFNQISKVNASLKVNVLETVEGIQVPDLPYAWSVNKTLHLNAEIQFKPHLKLLWTFQHNEEPTFLVTGYSAEYTPPRTGTLLVHLNVSNHFCSSSLSSMVIIQEPVTGVILRSNLERVFLNQCVQFFAVPKDGSDLNFHWTFGDSPQNISGTEMSVEHCYSNPGVFVTNLFVYNKVSSIKAETLVNVTILGCKPPVAQLIEAPSTVTKAAGGHFEVSVDLKGCTDYRATYQWELHRGYNCRSNKLTLPSLETSGSLLTIRGHILGVGPYCLLFTVNLQGTPLSHNVTHLLTVTHSPLVALIQGGSNRTWPILKYLVLDGTESRDPDIEEGMKEEDTLEYEWSSEPVDVNKDPPCLLPNLPPISNISLSLPGLCAGRTFIFTLTIHKPGRRPATAEQMVSFHSGNILVVSIHCISCYMVSSTQISDVVPVTLSGQCDTCDNSTQYLWTAGDSNGHVLALDNKTTSTGPNKRELVIRKGSLEDGLSYTFTLYVTQPVELTRGESSITLTPNTPPTGGQCTLLPQSTILWLKTPLQYNCTGWMDPDTGGQLLFCLSVRICSHFSCQRLYLYRGPRSWHSVQAPAGSQAGEIQVFLEIENMKGSRTLAINRTLLVSIPHTHPGISTTRLWSGHNKEIVQNLQAQGDIHYVVPHALEIVTALNLDTNNTEEEKLKRVGIRDNVTNALTSLHVSNLWEVSAVSAALTQCVVEPHEITPGTWLKTLEAAENMIHMLDKENSQGHRAECETSENLLTLLGGALAASSTKDLSLVAFNLTSALMMSLMRSRVLSEEPLSLDVPGVQLHGARVLPDDLICTTSSAHCPLGTMQEMPRALKGHRELLQLVTELEVNPFSPGAIPDTPVTTQLVGLELRSLEGDPVSVKDLPPESEIQLRLLVKKDITLKPTMLTLPPGGSANFTVTTSMTHASSGLHLYIRISLSKDFACDLENSPELLVVWSPVHPTNRSDGFGSHVFRISPKTDAVQELSLLLPTSPLSLMEYNINVTSRLSTYMVTISISLFSSLCQYFHVPSQTWRTDGMMPSNASQPNQVVCNTRHLTVFGASLFVPPHHLVLLPPAPRSGQWTLVILVCSLLLSLFLVVAIISHKLDDLDVSRVGTIPLCGQRGQYRYWVLVKTGWTKGAGTTAHVGISLCGLSKSGARHLESGGAFSRGSIDFFQVETDSNLGEIWKIRIWHDNTGLDPSWFLQYVAVWDKQTDFLYFFLVNDWLSVENEHNGGRVEKEVLAACPQELRGFPRVFWAQLILGFTDWHLWASMWWRPARSRFTRVQRVTCCSVTLHLYVAACALWYGAVGYRGESYPLGAHSSVTWESIIVGVTVSLIIFPLQLLFTFLFRKTRSMVTVEDTSISSAATEPETCGDNSSLFPFTVYGEKVPIEMISFLFQDSLTSSKLNFDLGDHVFWQEESCAPLWFSSCDTIYDSPHDALCVMGSEADLSLARSLRRKKGKIHLGVASACSSGDDPLSMSAGSGCSRRLTWSEENLLQSITAGIHPVEESDSGRYSNRTELRSTSPESFISYWSENEPCSEVGCCSQNINWAEDKRWSFSSSFVSEGNSLDPELQYCSDIPSLSPSPFTTRIGVRWIPPGWLFPSCMLWVTYLVLLMLLALCIVLTALYSSSLSDYGILMWLISSTFALLTSAVFLEPIKVLLLSVYTALYSPPVLSEADGLVEEPLIKKMSDRPCTIRAPGGYSLLQAKEEARRVRALRVLLRSCGGYMVFFLLVLMVNFQSSLHDVNIRLLHTTMKQSVTRATRPDLNFTSITSVSDLWLWLNTTLPEHLYSDSQLTLIGAPVLCQQPDNVLPGGLDRNMSGKRICKTVFNNLPVLLHHSPPQCYPVSSSGQSPCQSLGTNKDETEREISRLPVRNWIRESALYVEIAQYHCNVHLHISTRLYISLSIPGQAVTSISILPFHLQEMTNGLDLPLALSLSLLFAALCFLSLELCAFSKVRTEGYAPHWRHLVLGMFSGATGSVHILRTYLTKKLMEEHRARPRAFTSLHAVANLARTEVTLAATLLLLMMLILARQLRFVRRWAIFGKAFQNARKELLGSSLLLVIVILVVTHCVSVVSTVAGGRQQLVYLVYSHTGSPFCSLDLLSFISPHCSPQNTVHKRIHCPSCPAEFPFAGMLCCYRIWPAWCVQGVSMRLHAKRPSEGSR